MTPLGDLGPLGSGLARPESVLSTSDGTLHVSDWRGGVTLIRPDGTQHPVLAAGSFRPRPNGIAIRPDGGWLLAHLDESDDGVYRMDSAHLGHLLKSRYGTMSDAKARLGNIGAIRSAFSGLQRDLYRN